MSRKTPALLLACLLVPALLSANSDLRVSMSGVPQTSPLGATIEWTATFINEGDATVHDVYMSASLGNDRCVDERFPLKADETRTYRCATKLPASAPPYGVLAYVSIASTGDLDRDATNNVVSQTVRFETKPDLRIFFGHAEPTYPGLPFTVNIAYTNLAFTTAEDVHFTIDVPRAISVRALSEGCTAAGTRVTCDVGDLGEPDFSRPTPMVRIEVTAPEESGLAYEAIGTIESPTGDQHPEDNQFFTTFRNYRTAYVTNTNDAGEGSLRAAVQAANSFACEGFTNPCMIAFRMPELTGVAVIRLKTALPVVTAENILIDGTTQARYVRDSNAAGPEFELRGSDLAEGDGIVLASPCAAVVKGLAITGFPRHGIYATTLGPCPPRGYVGGGRAIRENYLGVDATGTTVVPNLRGIYSDSVLPPSIFQNVISGNRRAGVFIVRGAANVGSNVIGLDPMGTKAMGNGASGIYFGAAATGSDATRNHIAFNADSGVSIDSAAAYVNVFQNAIHANHQLAVDFGLDGPTPSVPVQAPTIASAQYDAAKDTTTIVVAPLVNATWVDLYANDAPDPGGFGEGQTFLGTVPFNNRVVQLVYPGDLRGKWIAGQAIQQVITTFSGAPRVHTDAQGPYANTTSSEFGLAVAVTP